MRVFARYDAVAAPVAMRTAAAAFQRRYGVEFATFAHFSAEALDVLHTRRTDEDVLMRNVRVVTTETPTLLSQFAVLSRVANAAAPAAADRLAYFSALQEVYRAMGSGMTDDDDRLVVAPEREGRILAEALGWLRHGRDVAPHAKRIPYEHGLLVGLSDCRLPNEATKLVCIDGAIASGATMIALLNQLARPGVPVTIRSVHAAREGLRAILRYARSARLDVRIEVGHVTAGLSPKFYAVDCEDDSLVVGDLGDMIVGEPVAVAEP